MLTHPSISIRIDLWILVSLPEPQSVSLSFRCPRLPGFGRPEPLQGAAAPPDMSPRLRVPLCFRKAASGALSSSCTFPPSALLSKKPGSFSVDSEKPKSGHTKTHTQHIWVLDVRLGFPKALAVTGFLFHRKDCEQTTPVVCTEPSPLMPSKTRARF